MTDDVTEAMTAYRADRTAKQAAIKRWARTACKASGRQMKVLAALMGERASWLSGRVSGGAILTMDQMEKLAKATGIAVSEDARAARLSLSQRTPKTDVIAKPTHWVHLLSSATVPDGPADLEMTYLIGLAQRLRHSKFEARNVAMLRARFGIESGSPLSLAAVGLQFGMSREGVRRIEEATFTTIAKFVTDIQTPSLAAVMECPASSRGSLSVGLLGAVPLSEAMRFIAAANRPESRRELTTGNCPP
ncbi:MAG: hypothetical protein ACREPQ_14545 [Rhodanobacter sp.]